MPEQFVLPTEYKYVIISENVESTDLEVGFRFPLCNFGYTILSISWKKKKKSLKNS